MEGFDGDKVSQEYLNNLLQNPPQPVNFRYSVNDIANAIANFSPKNDNKSGNIIEDYQDNYYDKVGSISAVASAVYRFYSMPYKNNIAMVRSIIDEINNNIGSNMEMPIELSQAIRDINNHEKYLYDMQMINEYNSKQATAQQQEQQTQNEQLNNQQEQQIQEARFNEIQSKLPLINEKLNHIRELPKSSNVYETRKEELLRERLYFYHRKNNITQDDMDRLNNYIATLDAIEQEIVNSNQQTQQVEQPTIQDEQPNLQEQEQINQLKGQIQQYDNQIAMLLASIQPYMQVPKINNEISKVIAKNNEINSSQIIDSLTDYQRVVEMKQQLVTYLQQADKVIKDKVAGLQQQEQKVEEQPIIQEQPQIQPQTQSTNQIPNDDFWAEFDAPQQEQKPQEPLPDNFWDEFDNPQQMTRPERIYNDDGTYTMEYIAYQANTPLGFNQTIYDQLLQHNTDIRTKKNNAGLTSQQADAMIQAMINGTLDTNGQPIVPEEEQMTSGRHMGFINVKILGAIATIVSLVAILGIVLLNLK